VRILDLRISGFEDLRVSGFGFQDLRISFQDLISGFSERHPHGCQ
jgi:hypothetical protein